MSAAPARWPRRSGWTCRSARCWPGLELAAVRPRGPADHVLRLRRRHAADGVAIVLQEEELDEFRFTRPADLGRFPVRARSCAAPPPRWPRSRSTARVTCRPAGSRRERSGRAGAVTSASAGHAAALTVLAAPNTSARWRSAAGITSATVICRPVSADSEVTVASLMPHGTMRSYQDRSQSQFSAKPCMVTPLATRMPIARDLPVRPAVPVREPGAAAPFDPDCLHAELGADADHAPPRSAGRSR